MDLGGQRGATIINQRTAATVEAQQRPKKGHREACGFRLCHQYLVLNIFIELGQVAEKGTASQPAVLGISRQRRLQPGRPMTVSASLAPEEIIGVLDLPLFC